MHVANFLRDLFEQGRVRVPDSPASSDELVEAAGELASFERRWKLEFPGPPPAYNPQAALWAAELLYKSCLFVVHRDLGADLAERELSLPCPAPDSPSVHYSVDLTFRFLPDVYRLAKFAAGNDPLLKLLVRLAAAWPLSSVGMAGLTVEQLDSIVGHPGLLQLYVDRIMARHDESRLDDRRVRAAARQALGKFPELDPQTARAVERLEPELHES